MFKIKLLKVKNLHTNLKNTQALSVNASLYQNAGATITQQLAYTLAHINEYFNLIENFNKTIVVEVALGTNYFFEIAKLRALRVLFDSLNEIYNTQAKLHILAFPTKRNKTLYDYNTNMLRTTTECMSAIIGGADAVMNLPYDTIFHKNYYTYLFISFKFTKSSNSFLNLFSLYFFASSETVS